MNFKKIIRLWAIPVTVFLLSLSVLMQPSPIAAQEDLFGGSGIADPGATFFGDSSGSDNAGVVNNVSIFVSRVIGSLTVLAGLFFIVYFVIGAFRWVASGGDSGAIQKARDQMLQSAIGLVIVVAAYSVISLLGSVIGLDILDPATTIQSLIPNG